MDKNQKIKLGISVGDINGIGLEIILKTFEDARMYDFCTPVVFCSSKLVAAYKNKLEIRGVRTFTVNNFDKLSSDKLNVYSAQKESPKIELGVENKEGGKYAYYSLKSAVEFLKSGAIDVLVTAPINKNNIQSDEFNFRGHTEYLEAEFEGKSLMILMTDEIKIGLITGHIPVSKVAETITAELITAKVNTMHASLVQDFGINKPKIAVLGLNPHCGDHGVIGAEDDELVKPALEQIQQKGKLVYGPYAADSFFGSESYKNFDGVLAMYHDQGLGPFKTLAFGKGVNFTAGLNMVRTSPDHGTAYEIAGKNKADFNSFREAVFSAIRIFKTRKNHINLSKNKLKVKSVSKN